MFGSGWVNTDAFFTQQSAGLTANDAVAGNYANMDSGAFPNTRITGARSSTSLARVKAEDVERSTKIISVETASHLTSYEDPIKLVLPPVIQDANVVFVTRKFAVGNVATEVPEKAPAPVVSVQEESRRIRLRRFGGDIEFNVNTCAVPQLFKKEMDLKVGAQHAALAQQLVTLGYERLMHDGTDFVAALVRSTGGASSARLARHYYESQVFGALGKQTYALQNLLAAAKRCTAYDISRSVKTVMILPHGVPELMAYSKAENMTYEINGIRGPQGKPITLTVESGYTVPASTAKVFVHIPPARHMHNQVAPHAGKNELESEVTLILRYQRNGNATQCVDLHNRRLEEIPDGTSYRIVKLKMMHAILAVPGADTGNLLMQYPRSTVSADASTESGLMQLRVYMGAVLKRPENVLIMRNVAFNGFVDEEATLTDAQGVIAKLNLEPDGNPDDFVTGLANCHNGSMYDAQGGLVRSNDGPLGHLDDPAMAHRLLGSQVYDEAISALIANTHATKTTPAPPRTEGTAEEPLEVEKEA